MKKKGTINRLLDRYDTGNEDIYFNKEYYYKCITCGSTQRVCDNVIDPECDHCNSKLIIMEE